MTRTPTILLSALSLLASSVTFAAPKLLPPFLRCDLTDPEASVQDINSYFKGVPYFAELSGPYKTAQGEPYLALNVARMVDVPFGTDPDIRWKPYRMVAVYGSLHQETYRVDDENRDTRLETARVTPMQYKGTVTLEEDFPWTARCTRIIAPVQPN
jgi:hypothetical protein